MKLYACDKTVLRFYPKAPAFLNGYTTNTIDAPRTALVDLQGRIIAVADQFKKNEDEIWLVVETPFADRVMEHLKKYLSLSETTVEKLATHVYRDLDTGELIFSEDPMPASATEEDFEMFRLGHKMPVQGRDYDREMLLNLGDAGLVSFTKGCYLGQEIIARVHYKGRPPKRLELRDGRFIFVENP